MLPDALSPYRYLWPRASLANDPRWQPLADGTRFVRLLPETDAELARDSQWPAFFPSPLCLVTSSDGSVMVLEREVGASIVNRFPYVMALSFCRMPLSDRHHVRAVFTDVLERGGCVAVQYVLPGPELDRILATIATFPEEQAGDRIAATGLATRRAATNRAPVFACAYLVYEARLVKPGRDWRGNSTCPASWLDVGSHRTYFLEIEAIQLRADIADGRSQIVWRSLPAWQPRWADSSPLDGAERTLPNEAPRYQKSYTPHYLFPSAGTTAFEYDALHEGMAVKYLPPLPEDQLEVDNDRARWPCFFPSSAGMITTWADNGLANLMPCGSTTVLSRHPFIVAPCVTYARINERYAPRASLDLIRKTGVFGCGVPFISEQVVSAMRYAGNISFAQDPHKVANAGLHVEHGAFTPVLPSLPIHFECKVIGEILLGTHAVFLGEVRRILVRGDVSPENPLEWCPWPAVLPAGAASGVSTSAVGKT